MALHCVSKLYKCASSSHINKLLGCQAIRPYANYPPDLYKAAVVQPQQIDALEENGELQTLKFQPILPAPVTRNSSIFYDRTLEKFTNLVMQCGQRALARELMERAFFEIKKIQLKKFHETSEEGRDKIECNPLNIFHKAVDNCKPLLSVTRIKRGASHYQVPIPISESRSEFLSMRWLVEAGRDKDLLTRFPAKLAKELIDAAHNEGRVIKKKQDLHKLCEANRAYAHFRS